MVNLLCICQKLIFGRFFFWQKPKFLAGHYWKHCHTLDLCCVNSVHRMFDHRLCSKCISRIATFVFVSSDCSTISCDYPWGFCWTYLGDLISKTATLILIAPINSTQLYLKPRFWNRIPGVANIMRRGQDLGRAVLGKLSARELYTCVLIFVPPRFSALQCQEENLL